MNELAELRKLCNHRPLEWIMIDGRRGARCICGLEMFVPLANEVCWTCGAYRVDGCECKYEAPPERVWTAEELRADAEERRAQEHERLVELRGF